MGTITHSSKLYSVEQTNEGFKVHISPEIVGVIHPQYGYTLCKTYKSTETAISAANLHVGEELKRNRELRKQMAEIGWEEKWLHIYENRPLIENYME